MGMGGHLMWTGVARNLRRQKGLKLLPIENGGICRSSIFLNNDNFSSCPEGAKKIKFNNFTYLYDGPRVRFKTKNHIIKWTCEKIGLIEPIDLKCELFLSELEEERGGRICNLLPKKYACIEPHSKTSWMKSRLYSFYKYQNIVNALQDKINFVQIGAPGAKKLENVIYTNGELTFRENYKILENASFLLSTEGGLVHLANSANTKSFVIYTSYQFPEMTMYPENHCIDISLYRDEILGYKSHRLYFDEVEKHDESIIIEMIKNENLF
jgi:hypothetical protein